MKVFILVLLMLMFVAFPVLAKEFELQSIEYNYTPNVEPENAKVYKTNFFDNWDKWDTTLLALRIIDWRQTIQGQKNGYIEYNPVLGKHPSFNEIDKYFIGLIMLDYIIDNHCPKKIKNIWIKTNLIIEVACVGNNATVGIKLNI